MPRCARNKNEEYCIYHVIERGNERKDIFHDDADKRKFLDVLYKSKEKYGFKLYAYCLMDNHVHLLIDTNGSDISQLMKSINVSYVSYFNRKYCRCGHLFQDRFKSEVIDSDAYLLEVSRYIHLNPVKAKLVEDAQDYYWSSYSIYTGQQTRQAVVDVTVILSYFSENIVKAQREYDGYVQHRAEDIVTEESSACPIDFCNETEDTESGKMSMAEVQNFLRKIAIAHDIEITQFTMKKSKHSKLRNFAIREIRKNTHWTLKEIGDLFGGISEAAVSKILKTNISSR